VTFICHLLKFALVKGVGFNASTNLAYNKVFGLLEILPLLVLF
jgi:hypothetical protein